MNKRGDIWCFQVSTFRIILGRIYGDIWMSTEYYTPSRIYFLKIKIFKHICFFYSFFYIMRHILAKNHVFSQHQCHLFEMNNQYCISNNIYNSILGIWKVLWKMVELFNYLARMKYNQSIEKLPDFHVYSDIFFGKKIFLVTVDCWGRVGFFILIIYTMIGLKHILYFLY